MQKLTSLDESLQKNNTPYRACSPLRAVLLVFLLTITVHAQDHTLYQSTDGGLAWKQIGSTIKTRINVLHGEADRLWSGAEKGLSVSRDAGKTWRDLGQSQLGDIRAIASSPDAMILGTKTGLWRGAKGAAWAQPEGALKTRYIRAAATDGAKFYIGTDNGEIFFSEDTGLSWTALNQGLPEAGQIHDLKVGLDGSIVAGLYSKGTYAFRDATWQIIHPRYGFSVLPLDNGHIIVGDNPGGLIRTDDAGKTWISLPEPDISVPSWVLYRHKDRLFYGTSAKSGLYRSDDHGKNWLPTAEKEFANKAVVTIASVGETLVAVTRK